MTSDKPSKAGPRPAARGCPICGARAREQTRPFCSRRCAEVDLGRWLTGAYRIPTDEAPAGEVQAGEVQAGEPQDRCDESDETTH
ncbi:MAG: DNA gyrase inhibitor YacG [Kiloniellaceae bacterium]